MTALQRYLVTPWLCRPVSVTFSQEFTACHAGTIELMCYDPLCFAWIDESLDNLLHGETHG